jgi:hypothetical protein
MCHIGARDTCQSLIKRNPSRQLYWPLFPSWLSSEQEEYDRGELKDALRILFNLDARTSSIDLFKVSVFSNNPSIVSKSASFTKMDWLSSSCKATRVILLLLRKAVWELRFCCFRFSDLSTLIGSFLVWPVLRGWIFWPWLAVKDTENVEVFFTVWCEDWILDILGGIAIPVVWGLEGELYCKASYCDWSGIR